MWDCYSIVVVVVFDECVVFFPPLDPRARQVAHTDVNPTSSLLMDSRMKPLPCFLKRDCIVVALDAHHVSHTEFARSVRLSRSYWSQLLNGHRPVSTRVRRAMLCHPCLRDIPEDQLWVRGDPGGSGPPPDPVESVGAEPEG